MTKPQFIKVKPQDAAMRLDRWFKLYYPQITVGLFNKLLRKNAIKVDGKKAKGDVTLEAGQEIRVPAVESLHPSVVKANANNATEHQARELITENIIYCDKNLLAINKPAGLPVQGGSKINLCVDDLLPFIEEEGDKLKLVHRLDKDTSGVLLLARNFKAASSAGKDFQGKDFHKTYWALLVGVPDLKEGVIDLPLATGESGGTEKIVVDEENGKRAVTYYKVVVKVSDKLCWVAMQPISGKKHQLRVHMNAIGHPIIGDGKYGGKDAFIDGLSRKMHLHARRIYNESFMGSELDIVAKLPAHMLKSWDMFEFDANDTSEHFTDLG